MTRFCRALVSLAVFPVLALVVHAASADEVVARARRYLGAERDIEAIRSIRYRGQIEVRDAAGALVADTSGSLDMIVQKPAQQLDVRTSAKVRDTVGLDDLTGWQQHERLDQPTRPRVVILPMAELRRLQAVTFENLAFFRGLERRGGKIESRGESLLDGVPVDVVAFVHPHDIVFVRYFDKATGRLLLTEDTTGAKIREEGEVVVGGVRFSRRMLSTGKLANGTDFTVTITFDDIKVNETYPAELFAVPMPKAK